VAPAGAVRCALCRRRGVFVRDEDARGLGFGTKTVRYEVEVTFRAHRRRGSRIHGLGNFRDLRQLCLEGVAS